VRAGLAAARQSAQRRIDRLNEIIRLLESGTLANHPHAPRRWEANRQLALADCCALRWSAQQFVLAVDDFERKPEFHPRADYYTVDAGSYSRRPPLRGGERMQQARQAAVALYQQVIADHPGTPWADTARSVRHFNTYWVSPHVPSDSTYTYTPAPTAPNL
jgi:hypothetical protein